MFAATALLAQRVLAVERMEERRHMGRHVCRSASINAGLGACAAGYQYRVSISTSGTRSTNKTQKYMGRCLMYRHLMRDSKYKGIRARGSHIENSIEKGGLASEKGFHRA